MPVSLPSQAELTLALAGAMDETAGKMVAHAEVMRERGRELLAEATRLEEEANALFSSSRVMGVEGGESEAEAEEVHDHGMTVNGRGEKVTYDVALDAAKRLARFTRQRFAEDLDVKPTVAGRWLARLREQKALHVDESGEMPMYEYALGAPIPSEQPGRIETKAERAERLGAWEDDRGRPVSGTSKRAKRMREAGSQTGQRRPGRRN